MKKILISTLLLMAISITGYFMMDANDPKFLFFAPDVVDVSSPQEPSAMSVSKNTAGAHVTPMENNTVNDDSAIASANGPLPEGVDRKEKSPRMKMWEEGGEINVDGIAGFAITAKPHLSSYLDINQLIEFPIPNEAKTLMATIEGTHNHTSNVAVWKGKINGGSAFDNVTIVKGKIETHITIATEEATYIAIVDNQSGKGSIVNQSDINAGQVPFDDAIPVEPLDVQPPDLSYRSK